MQHGPRRGRPFLSSFSKPKGHEKYCATSGVITSDLLCSLGVGSSWVAVFIDSYAIHPLKGSSRDVRQLSVQCRLSGMEYSDGFSISTTIHEIGFQSPVLPRTVAATSDDTLFSECHPTLAEMNARMDSTCCSAVTGGFR